MFRGVIFKTRRSHCDVCLPTFPNWNAMRFISFFFSHLVVIGFLKYIYIYKYKDTTRQIINKFLEM